MVKIPLEVADREAKEPAVGPAPFNTENQSSGNDKSSDATAGNLQTLSKSKARRIKRKIKASQEGQLEGVTKQDADLYNIVKKSWFRSSSRQPKHMGPYIIYTINNGNEENIGNLEDGPVDNEEKGFNDVTPKEVEDKDEASNEIANNTNVNGHTKKKKKRNKSGKKLQSRTANFSESGNATGAEDPDSTEKETNQSAGNNVERDADGTEIRKAETSQNDTVPEKNSDEPRVDPNADATYRSSSLEPFNKNKDDTSATSCTLQCTEAEDSPRPTRESCEQTIFQRNGIVFGHHSEPSSGTVPAFPVDRNVPFEQDYHHQNSFPFNQSLPFVHPDEGWAQCPVPYQDQFLRPPYPEYGPPCPFRDGNYGIPPQYPHPMHGQQCPPYNGMGHYPSHEEQHHYDERADHARHRTSFHQAYYTPNFTNIGGITHNSQLPDANPTGMAPHVDGAANGVMEPFNFDKRQSTASTAQRVWEYDHQSLVDAQIQPEIEPVTDYLLRAFRSCVRSDYQLNLQSTKAEYPPLSFYPHSLVMWRNSHLSEIIRKIENQQLSRTINLVAEDCFSDPRAFDVALQNIYGAPLASERQLSSPNILTFGWGRQSGAIGRMNFACSYLSSGAFLAERAIIQRAIRLIISLLDWNTVETLVHFGLDSTKFLLACTDDVARDRSLDSDNSDTDSINTMDSFRINDTYRVPRPDNAFMSMKTLNRELVHIWSTKLVQKALRFVARNLPEDFEFDSGARSAVMPDRLAWPQEEHRSSAENNLTPGSDEHKLKVTSALLVGLPYKHLRDLLKYIDKAGKLSTSLVRDVVAQREVRRQSTLKNLELHDSDEPQFLTSDIPLGWEEYIEEEGGEICVKRVWKGLENAHSAPAPSNGCQL
ncbi:hypothetical protein PRK78_004536 [Emydomyces testavorans]|uniref:Uncharacterized protein n=1 Tax=Emydomyces testavorans TaxID=2070801 RepID=A0AAF0IJB4_9EURO|nr:hypothetical protein PRK78_004536 [Emydomyces testavorans]